MQAEKTVQLDAGKFAKFDSLIKQASSLHSKRDFERACELFEIAIHDGRRTAAFCEDDEGTKRLIPAYEQAALAAYRQASLPDNSIAANWGGKALAWHTQHVVLLSSLLSRQKQLSPESCSTLGAALEKLSERLCLAGNYAQAIHFSDLLRELIAQNPLSFKNMEYLRSCELRANAFIGLGQLEKAAQSINEGLADIDTPNCADPARLRFIAALLQRKVILLGEIERHKRK